jgi:hypothetical protein
MKGVLTPALAAAAQAAAADAPCNQQNTAKSTDLQHRPAQVAAVLQRAMTANIES